MHNLPHARMRAVYPADAFAKAFLAISVQYVEWIIVRYRVLVAVYYFKQAFVMFYL